MRNYFILVLTALISFALCNERIFNLKSGNKVTGDIVNIDDSGNYTVNTSMGEVVFNQNEIVMEHVKITTTDGDRIIGVLQNEDNDKFHVKTDIGLLSIAKIKVNLIDFNYDDIESDDGFLNGLSKSDKRFYFGDEQLIDVWFDPTGNVLSEGTIYISGLSGAYGITDKFQISLRVWDYLFGNVNIRPKYQIYKKGTLKKSNTLSVGAHLYLTGAVPHKWIMEKRQGVSLLDIEGNWSPITSDEPSYELFIAYTSSKLKSSGQGRLNYNMGISIAEIGGYSETMSRIWLGADIDVRKSLKLTGLIAYDPHLPTIAELFNGGEQTDLHLDFGFIYALNDNFRFGLHLTSPFIGFYWKF
jgi:hypothetical protein|tara:strand:- start:176 stop:1246 length:1071 start_codon:yes stop_codon:yes gene_type:complete